MPDTGAFDTAYGRLATTCLVSDRGLDDTGARGGVAPRPPRPCQTPPSRLMRRLALMAPGAASRRRDVAD